MDEPGDLGATKADRLQSGRQAREVAASLNGLHCGIDKPRLIMGVNVGLG